MNFGVLGALQVTNGDHVVALAVTPKARLLLTVLLADAGRPVSVDGLVHAVWGPRPPRSARRNAQLYVHKLRSLLGAELIATAADGYMLTCADGVDAVRFAHRFKAGTAALRAGDPTASGLLRSALDLWRGPAYAGFLGCEPVADQARELEEQRLCAYERWAQACVAAHRFEEVADDLPPLVRAHPFRELLAAYLMTALHGLCRQAEALQVYQSTREVLRRQLGAEPGGSLQRAQRAVLRGEAPNVPA